MRNSIRLAVVSTALAAISFATAAQAADTATANASAEVLSTLSVTKDQDLLFGQIAVNADGDLTIAGDGTVTCAAGLICTGSRQPAAFTVTGTTGVAVVASVDQASVNLVHATDITKIFVLDAFDVYFPLGNTLAGGSAAFAVGGTLNVLQASSLAGVYSGSFDVTVEYQ